MEKNISFIKQMLQNSYPNLQRCNISPFIYAESGVSILGDNASTPPSQMFFGRIYVQSSSGQFLLENFANGDSVDLTFDCSNNLQILEDVLFNAITAPNGSDTFDYYFIGYRISIS